MLHPLSPRLSSAAGLGSRWEAQVIHMGDRVLATPEQAARVIFFLRKPIGHPITVSFSCVEGKGNRTTGESFVESGRISGTRLSDYRLRVTLKKTI